MIVGWQFQGFKKRNIRHTVGCVIIIKIQHRVVDDWSLDRIDMKYKKPAWQQIDRISLHSDFYQILVKNRQDGFLNLIQMLQFGDLGIYEWKRCCDIQIPTHVNE